MSEFFSLPLGAKIYAFIIILGAIAFFVVGFAGFCGWSKVKDEDGKERWHIIWRNKKNKE